MGSFSKDGFRPTEDWERFGRDRENPGTEPRSGGPHGAAGGSGAAFSAAPTDRPCPGPSPAFGPGWSWWRMRRFRGDRFRRNDFERGLWNFGGMRGKAQFGDVPVESGSDELHSSPVCGRARLGRGQLVAPRGRQIASVESKWMRKERPSAAPNIPVRPMDVGADVSPPDRDQSSPSPGMPSRRRSAPPLLSWNVPMGALAMKRI